MVTERYPLHSPAASTTMVEFRRIVSVFSQRKLAVFGFCIIAAVIIMAIFAPLLAPYDPYKMNLPEKLLQPSWRHLLGTDSLGRDTLSRIIYGARTSLMVGLISIGLASTIGTTLGLVAGYFGGMVNAVIMRLVDSMMAIPMLIKALVITALLGPGLTNVMIALGIGMTSTFARLMCGQILSAKESDYVAAQRGIGSSHLRIMLVHLLPNCFPPLLVTITLLLGMAILMEAGLSFLGLGIEPPGAAWGSMVNEGYKFLLTNPVLSFAPGISIMLVVLAFNMMGDGLRDALDPRLRGSL